MKSGNEARELSRHLSDFVEVYAPNHLTQSEHTCHSYRSSLNKYLAFLEDQKGCKTTTLSKACFERPVIEEWMRHMRKEEGLEPETCNVRLAGLRAFLKYLSSRNVVYAYLYAEAENIPVMKTAKKHVNGLSKNAVKAIMKEPDQRTVTGRRDLVFLMIAYGIAARISEILGIRLKQIHLEDKNPYIILFGKGEKTRTMYILSKLAAHLKKYIQEAHGDHPDPEDYLFYSRNGTHKDQLSSKAIEKRLRLYAASAHEKCEDVPLDLHMHQFRHARATHWMEEGMNIVEISYLLGHEQLETTMKYLDVTIDSLRKAQAVLDDEDTSKVSKKWKKNKNSLKSLLK